MADQDKINGLAATGHISFPRAEAVQKLILHHYKETPDLAAAVASAKDPTKIAAYLSADKDRRGKAYRDRIDRLVSAGAKISDILAAPDKIPWRDPDPARDIDYSLMIELLGAGQTFPQAAATLAALDLPDEVREIALMLVKAGETTAAAKDAALVLCHKAEAPAPAKG